MRVATETKRSPEAFSQQKTLTPAVDIYENADEVLLLADLPGVTNDKLSVVFDQGELTIEGTQTAREGTVFKRSFTVSQELDPAKIGAEIKDGVLTVHLPKAAAAKPRQINVRTSV